MPLPRESVPGEATSLGLTFACGGRKFTVTLFVKDEKNPNKDAEYGSPLAEASDGEYDYFDGGFVVQGLRKIIEVGVTQNTDGRSGSDAITAKATGQKKKSSEPSTEQALAIKIKLQDGNKVEFKVPADQDIHYEQDPKTEKGTFTSLLKPPH